MENNKTNEPFSRRMAHFYDWKLLPT